jgi:hypothetical protein
MGLCPLGLTETRDKSYEREHKKKGN